MIRHLAPFLATLAIVTGANAQQTACTQDSPERRGGAGCTIVAEKRLPGLLPSPVFWHIDEFSSLAAARLAEDSTRVAFEAGGSGWLYSFDSDTTNHHGGEHRAVVGPLPIQSNRPYSVMAMSTRFLPGAFSPVHTHSGPEAWWVLEGEQCLQTTRTTIRAHAGQSALVAEGDTMRMTATGTGPRRALVLILHDANRPAIVRLENHPPLKNCD
jgi:quercetin dioxygenase-like cupin family protein